MIEEKNKIKEDLEITIKEKSNKEDEIKELNFSINTGQSGNAEFVSDIINGELEVIMISSDNNIGIEISFVEFEDIVLLDMVDFSGRKYLPLRISGIVKDGQNIIGSSEKWVLNNRLRFRVKGPFNTNVNFIVRWE